MHKVTLNYVRYKFLEAVFVLYIETVRHKLSKDSIMSSIFAIKSTRFTIFVQLPSCAKWSQKIPFFVCLVQWSLFFRVRIILIEMTKPDSDYLFGAVRLSCIGPHLCVCCALNSAIEFALVSNGKCRVWFFLCKYFLYCQIKN